ncbi:helicase-like transcription factor CHR28 [Dioscorea cayenensis subsp. rotundata]|uniref:Helicase-like transcription factor CHR28 n=1 Tax=Dioscorea cayennensis subsp. rotundata TaxID=55577 RepID=A0AB40CGI9_DIOCR|nr:helicase-like transcription factor CHR28 [Dioscorea cayenensis subsp. rotundata]XP_039138677.1 helicase-like transcription factor CHR28 [Dioscorea cayenensis subsp. rotundata]
MDVIQIDSSDSDDDFGGYGRGESSYVSQEGFSHVPRLNDHVEISLWNEQEPDGTYSDKWGVDTRDPSQNKQRILPSSFQPLVSKNLPRYSNSHEGTSYVPQNEVPRNNGSNRSPMVEDITDNRHGIHSEQQLNVGKRTLPNSLQPTRPRPALEVSHSSMGTNVVGHKPYVDDGRTIDDFHMRESNGKHRHLPPSIINGANSANGSSMLSHSSFRNEKFLPNSMPKSMKEIRDDNYIQENVGTSRILPSSFMYGKPGSSSQLVNSSDVVNRIPLGEERRIEHDERIIYQEALQNLNQPKMEDDLPEGLLTVSLLKHQKIALAWMVQKEKSVLCAGGILADDQGLGKTISMIALVQKQMSLQAKFTSDDSNNMKSEALNLDEDDDSTIELDKGKDIEKDDNKKPVADVSTSRNWRPAGGTLVVCPASVLRQWARELDEKVTSDAKLSVLIYHGGARTKNPCELAKHNVVLTTYSIVTNEVPKQPLVDDDDGDLKNLEKAEISQEFSNKKRKQPSNTGSKSKKKGKGGKNSNLDYDSGPLARVRWFRVILDEAQTIKNHRTQVSRACCGLRAKRRWCLSGTPIQNSIDDLYSYFKFLKYDPYAVYSSFCSSIKYPISRNASHGYKKLQAVLRTVLLRRTKGTILNGEPIVKLPPKTVCLKKVDFSSEERAFYLRLEADSRKQFKAYAAAGTVKQNYANILFMLLRLRQACDHPILVKGFQSNAVGKDSIDIARQLPREMQINLLAHLEGSLAICGVCSDPPEDGIVTMCGHVFCYQCIADRLTGDDNFCPAPGCKDMLGSDLVFSRETLKSCISGELTGSTSASNTHDDESSITQSSFISSKIRAALEILNSISNPYSKFASEENDFFPGHLCSNTEPPVKAIVFSQWTRMLDLLEMSLNQSLIQYRRLDGTMSLLARDRAVKEFNTDPEVTVMIMSLKAGNLGLNMVAASHVILLDLWWNPTTEDQAVDRAHRIGQTRPVTVSRLTIKDTVEDRILALQEEKRNMVSSAFGEDHSGGHATRLTVDDLRYLFMV